MFVSVRRAFCLDVFGFSFTTAEETSWLLLGVSQPAQWSLVVFSVWRLLPLSSQHGSQSYLYVCVSNVTRQATLCVCVYFINVCDEVQNKCVRARVCVESAFSSQLLTHPEV